MKLLDRAKRDAPGEKVNLTLTAGNEKGPQAAVEYGAAHGALAMTTPGDTSMVNVKEVEALMKGKGARVIR